MMMQYQSIRRTLSQDTILFFRLGDFYEMFLEDAKRASSILDITLTARDGGNNNKVPMCGIPFHSAQGYVNRLTHSGLKVAICEQIEDPKLTKGLVKREIVKIISPATNLEDDEDAANPFNYIAAICQKKSLWGCSYLDLGTGDFRVGEFLNVKELEDELIRLSPRECVVSRKMDWGILKNFFKEYDPTVNEYEDWIFDPEEARGKILDELDRKSVV